MVRKPPTLTSILVVAALLIAFAGWTVLTFTWAPLAAFDQRTLAPRLSPNSAGGQIAAAFALLTWPGLAYVAILGLAIWAAQHRLRQLAVGLVLTVGLGWGSELVLRAFFARPRPAQALDLISANGSSYPSAHMVATAAAVVAVAAIFAVTRRTPGAKLAWQLSAAAIVVAVGVNRWLLGAHFVSDLIGGLLLGVLVSTLALVIAGVSVPVAHEIVSELVRGKPVVDPEAEPGLRCAVVYNPSKVTDWVTFRRHVDYEATSRGWQRPMWLETTPEDSGVAMTQRAVDAGVDLVLGAGGDGTIRVICSGLAGTGIPFGLIPAGTGNLLARNIGIPLDEAAALHVAFDGVDKPIDLVRLTIDGATTHHFAVMAGIGIDAVIMQGTNPDLKKAVGSAAYFVSAAQNANHPASHATITMDEGVPLKRRAHVIVIGNVGFLQANIPLIPDAKPDDGLLDVMIASPRGMADWVKLTTRVLTRQRRTDAQLDRLTGRTVTITVEERDHYQLDGDTAGECNEMVAQVCPGALTLRVPRSWRRVVTTYAATSVEAAEGVVGTESAVGMGGDAGTGADRGSVGAGTAPDRVSVDAGPKLEHPPEAVATGR